MPANSHGFANEIVMVITGKDVFADFLCGFFCIRQILQGSSFFNFDEFCIWHSIQTCNLVS